MRELSRDIGRTKAGHFLWAFAIDCGVYDFFVCVLGSGCRISAYISETICSFSILDTVDDTMGSIDGMRKHATDIENSMRPIKRMRSLPLAEY